VNASSMRAQDGSPILLVDADFTSRSKLASRLGEHGFATEVATNCSTAGAVATAQRCGTVVVVADFRRAANVNDLIRLRHKLPRTWIVAVSKWQPTDEVETSLRFFADALVTPLSTEELVFRLRAFSQRSRPA
jgi:DNA-binding response OmpR family regulator